MGLEGHPQPDQRRRSDEGAEEHHRLGEGRAEQQRTDKEPKPGRGQREQQRVFGAGGEPFVQSGTSSGRSQPPPTSLLICVAKTRESLSTVPGGPSA